MTKRVYSVAIDGPAGAGKSTMARRAAKALGFVYVDTGAIYRAVAFAVLRAGIDPENSAAIEALLSGLELQIQWDDAGIQHILLCGEDVSSLIRSPQVSVTASHISALSAVRQFLLETQREVAQNHSVIMDGRDIGTVVLPHADVKIYLSASAEVRARRRFLELNGAESYEKVLQEMSERDWRDTHREIAPLRKADDAIVLDTSDLSMEESVQAILNIIREKLNL